MKDRHVGGEECELDCLLDTGRGTEHALLWVRVRVVGWSCTRRQHGLVMRVAGADPNVRAR